MLCHTVLYHTIAYYIPELGVLLFGSSQGHGLISQADLGVMREPFPLLPMSAPLFEDVSGWALRRRSSSTEGCT